MIDDDMTFADKMSYLVYITNSIESYIKEIELDHQMSYENESLLDVAKNLICAARQHIKLVEV